MPISKGHRIEVFWGLGKVAIKVVLPHWGGKGEGNTDGLSSSVLISCNFICGLWAHVIRCQSLSSCIYALPVSMVKQAVAYAVPPPPLCPPCVPLDYYNNVLFVCCIRCAPPRVSLDFLCVVYALPPLCSIIVL